MGWGCASPVLRRVRAWNFAAALLVPSHFERLCKWSGGSQNCCWLRVVLHGLYKQSGFLWGAFLESHFDSAWSVIKRNNSWWGILCVCACVSIHIQHNRKVQEIILPFDKEDWNHRGVLTRTNTPFIQKLSLNYHFKFVCTNSACLPANRACSQFWAKF